MSFQQKCSELDFQIDPTTVTIDYDLAALNAVTTTFSPRMFLPPHAKYTEQASEFGPRQRYREADDVKLFCGMLDGLAFLPVDDVPDGLASLKENISRSF